MIKCIKDKIKIVSFIKSPIHIAKDLLERTLSTRINSQITPGTITVIYI